MKKASVIILIFIEFFIVLFAVGLSYEKKPEPEPVIVLEDPFPVVIHTSEYSGFISNEVYMASFQQFNEGSYWIRVSRVGHEKIEFEVSSWEEAVIFFESLDQ